MLETRFKEIRMKHDELFYELYQTKWHSWEGNELSWAYLTQTYMSLAHPKLKLFRVWAHTFFSILKIHFFDSGLATSFLSDEV